MKNPFFHNTWFWSPSLNCCWDLMQHISALLYIVWDDDPPPPTCSPVTSPRSLRKRIHVCWLNDVQSLWRPSFFPPFWTGLWFLGLPSFIPLYPAHTPPLPPPPPLSRLSTGCKHESASAWMNRGGFPLLSFPSSAPPKEPAKKEEREREGISIHLVLTEAEYPAWCHGCFRVTFSWWPSLVLLSQCPVLTHFIIYIVHIINSGSVDST